MTDGLRRHQRLALEALEPRWADPSARSWVVLPPGAGKTRLGLEALRRLLADGTVDSAVVLSPNTAIAVQWEAQAAALDLPVTSWTYQSIAVFDAEDDGDDGSSSEPDRPRLADRLHENGRARLRELAERGDVLLVLDECHHLLEVWGRLLAEVLDELPRARVLGLTATPPERLTTTQATLVAELFGEIAYRTTIPAVVREGDLAPFAELVWVVEPTAAEQEWAADGALRFTELTTALCSPDLGSVPFLTWVTRRFVERAQEGAQVGGDPGRLAASWTRLAAEEPDLCRAALRLHHAGLLDLPPGARLLEEHRQPPSAEDWIELVDDWVVRCLLAGDDPADVRALDAVRQALPAVGHVLTRRGIRRGRCAIDRVLARSQAKTTATVSIALAEHAELGVDSRVLVLCDHERAGAVLPVDLEGVLPREAGSAVATLEALLAEPGTADALLVTGRTVASSPPVLEALRAIVARRDPGLAGRLRIVDDGGPGPARLEGPWTSRTWVRDVTALFDEGGVRTLVGTRGLLGEGWDARFVTALVDLTTATTATAVVQTRGRALRTDPDRPEKVALNWTVVCVAAEHPRGDLDWQRLVRKHDGFFGVDAEGRVLDGVGHLDPALSPFRPPPAAELDALNARMLLRAQDRDAVRARWRVGEPYEDRPGTTVTVRPRRPRSLGTATGPAAVVVGRDGLEVRLDGPAQRRTLRRLIPVLAALAVLAGLGLVGGVAGASPWLAAILAVALGVGGTAGVLEAQTRAGRALLRAAAQPPSVAQVAGAVADALRQVGRISRGSEALVVEPQPDGAYRCLLVGVDQRESALFADALDDALAPLVAPRYVVARDVVVPFGRTRRQLRAVARRHRATPDLVVWHPVPDVLGARAELARAYGEAFHRWLGGGRVRYTGSPDGAGVLAAQQGRDPFDVATSMRTHWR